MHPSNSHSCVFFTPAVRQPRLEVSVSMSGWFIYVTPVICLEGTLPFPEGHQERL